MNPYQEIIQDIRKKTHQEDVVKYLQDLDFEFINYSTLKQYIDIGEEYKYFQFLVRLRGDNPLKIDTKLIVYIKIMGDHINLYYIDRHFKDFSKLEKVDCPWRVGKIINMKKKKILTKFPDSLDIEERKVWRKFDERHQKGRLTDPKDLAWYLKFRPEIISLNAHLEIVNNQISLKK